MLNKSQKKQKEKNSKTPTENTTHKGIKHKTNGVANAEIKIAKITATQYFKNNFINNLNNQ